MKQLKNIILEKLIISSNLKNRKYKFDHIDKDKHECFWGYNWILNDGYYETSISLLKWALEKCSLNTNERDFIEKNIEDLEEKKNRNTITKLYTLNGSQNNGYYTLPKCIYDICQLIRKHNINDIRDENGNLMDFDIIKDIIFDLENVTNNAIKKLDWPH